MSELLATLFQGLGGMVAGALVNALLGWLEQRRAEQAREDLGRTKAERDGAEAVGKIANEQAKRATNPPDDEELLRRLAKGKG